MPKKYQHQLITFADRSAAKSDEYLGENA